MTAAADTVTKPLRWSSVRSCPRKAVYEAEGAPARDRTAKEERILYRGRTLGREYVVMLATATGKKIHVASGPTWWVPPELLEESRNDAGILAEVPIQWGLGTGHADAYVMETATIVEVLSSAHASDEMIQSKLLQAVGYAEHYEARNVALVILNPSDFTEERVVVVKESRQYQQLVVEMRERLAQLDVWRHKEITPERVCSKPSEARGHFCLYADHCFAGWEAPPIQEIAADETLQAAAREFYDAKRARDEISSQDKALEARQKDAQAILEAADLPAGMTVQIGPVKVTRTAVQRKPTFEWEKAEAAGRFHPDAVGEFFKPGARFSTFKAEKVADFVPDYGEVPF